MKESFSWHGAVGLPLSQANSEMQWEANFRENNDRSVKVCVCFKTCECSTAQPYWKSKAARSAQVVRSTGGQWDWRDPGNHPQNRERWKPAYVNPPPLQTSLQTSCQNQNKLPFYFSKAKSKLNVLGPTTQGLRFIEYNTTHCSRHAMEP